MGRPTDYREEYCDKVIALGESGASVVEMAYECGVSRETFENNWPKSHPEFLVALGAARLASQVWWEKKGREGMEKPGFNAAIWSRSMAARFPKDWREVKATELTGANGGPMEAVTHSPDEWAAKLKTETLRDLAENGK